MIELITDIVALVGFIIIIVGFIIYIILRTRDDKKHMEEITDRVLRIFDGEDDTEDANTSFINATPVDFSKAKVKEDGKGDD